MEHLEKKNIFQTPEGYFDTLPDKILSRHSKGKTRSLYRIITAAAAIVLLGIALFIFSNENSESNNLEANLEEEVYLYINAGHWKAEDVLSLSENPDLILDEIIATEWGEYQIEEDLYPENDLWF